MSVPQALLDLMNGSVHTTAHLWRVTPVDANGDPLTAYGFTDTDRDIEYSGVTFKAATGFFPSAIAKTGNPASDNLTVDGPLGVVNSEDITREDLFAGRLRGAVLEIFLCDYTDPDNTAWTMFKGTIGETTVKDDGFEVEVLALDHKLRQTIGRRIGPLCDAAFGDDRCGLPAANFTFPGAVTAVTDNAIFFDTSSAGIIDKAADYFGAGVLTWTTGDNANLSMDIKQFTAGQRFTLYEAMPYEIQVGDEFNALAGCRKRRGADCRDKFDNVVNFRGFPDVPGDKFMIKYARR